MSNKEQAKRYLATIIDYKKTFESERGQKVLLDLMKEASMVGSTIGTKDGSICVNQTFVNEGARNLVLYILKKLKFNEEKLLKVIEESVKGDLDE
jgi:hypothetical protein